MSEVTFTLNGEEKTVPAGTTIIRAAKEAGVSVPYYCWHPALSIAGNCRMCLVEVEKAPKLQIACQTQVQEGMVVHTESERVQEARGAVQEFLFIHHPLDCPVCDQAGECKLQEYFMRYEHHPGRYTEPKNYRPKVKDWGEMVVYDGERCINCTRCIRVMDEFAQQPCLGQVQRGSRTYIATFNDEPMPYGYAGNVVDFCPVGALTLKDFRFRQRVWFLTKSPSVCAGCERGCQTRVDHRDGEVFRVVPRGGESGDYFMCDDGRLHYKYVNEARLLSARVGGADVARAEAIVAAARRLAPVANAGLGAVLSASLLCEEAYGVALFARDVLGVKRVFVASRPDGVQDEILMRADRNANAWAVRAIAEGLGLEVVSLRDDPQALTQSLTRGDIKGLYIAGTDLREELTAETLSAAAKLEVLVVAASNVPELPAAAVQLPAASYLESNGTFVNFQRKVRRLAQAFSPRGHALPHWRLAHLVAGAMERQLGCAALSQFRGDADKILRAALDLAASEDRTEVTASVPG